MFPTPHFSFAPKIWIVPKSYDSRSFQSGILCRSRFRSRLNTTNQQKDHCIMVVTQRVSFQSWSFHCILKVQCYAIKTMSSRSILAATKKPDMVIMGNKKRNGQKFCHLRRVRLASIQAMSFRDTFSNNKTQNDFRLRSLQHNHARTSQTSDQHIQA